MPAGTVANSSLSLPERLAVVAADIKLSHSIFALPFALLATFLAAAHDRRIPSWGELGLIVLCMVFARTVAMTFNRLVDRKIDADNPRTQKRAIPGGKLSVSFVVGVLIVCVIGFIAAASGFWLLSGNPWPVILSPVVLLWICFYSLTKRFTWLCHLFLGSALALSPIAATIAIEPAYLTTPEPYLLAAMVMCWVAGFDVIYALQDVQVDQTLKLYSMPARLGVEPALWISRLLHAASVAALLALLWTSGPLAHGFAAGLAIVAGLLILEHALVWNSKTHHIHMAFFTVNGIISLLLGTLGIIDVVRYLH